MDSLVSFSPQNLTFHIKLSKQTSIVVNMTNISDYPIVYKVKTTNLKRDCVRPNAAVINPSHSVAIQIDQQAFKSVPPDIDSCPDRFLLMVASLQNIPQPSTPCSDPQTAVYGFASITELWQRIPSDFVHKKKMLVTLQMLPLPSELPSVDTPPEPPKAQQEHQPLKVLRPIPPTTTEPAPPAQAPQPPPPPPPPPAPTRQAPAPPPPLPAKPARHLPPPSNPSPPPIPPKPTQTPPIREQSPPQQPPTKPATPSPPASTQHQPPTPSPETPPSQPSATDTFSQRERVVHMRIAPKITLQKLQKSSRQRIAVERAAQLSTIITHRQSDIDAIELQLREARHRLSDARMATTPAYDVKYETNENASLPFAQIVIMAVISGALLQLLV